MLGRKKQGSFWDNWIDKGKPSERVGRKTKGPQNGSPVTETKQSEEI